MPSSTATGPDRRARRRQETIDEILEIAIELMGRDGVAGLNVSDIARRLGIQPPSLYKYFPSRLAIFDAVFRRGQEEHLAAIRAAVDASEPGLPALHAAIDASARFAHDNQVLAQLLIWRPAPGFEASPDAMAPSVEMVELMRSITREAVARNEIGAGAATDTGMALLSIVASGLVSQHLANEPDSSFEDGIFTSLVPDAVAMFVTAFPVAAKGPQR
jgi:AcrR family transcriptional regulator